MIDMNEILALRQAGDFKALTARGVTMSGGKSDQSVDGWLKAPFCGKKAHFFEQDKDFAGIDSGGRTRYWNALCGAVAATNDRAPMLAPGNWSRCKICERRASA